MPSVSKSCSPQRIRTVQFRTVVSIIASYSTLILRRFHHMHMHIPSLPSVHWTSATAFACLSDISYTVYEPGRTDGHHTCDLPPFTCPCLDLLINISHACSTALIGVSLTLLDVTSFGAPTTKCRTLRKTTHFLICLPCHCHHLTFVYRSTAEQSVVSFILCSLPTLYADMSLFAHHHTYAPSAVTDSRRYAACLDNASRVKR